MMLAEDLQADLSRLTFSSRSRIKVNAMGSPKLATPGTPGKAKRSDASLPYGTNMYLPTLRNRKGRIPSSNRTEDLYSLPTWSGQGGNDELYWQREDRSKLIPTTVEIADQIKAGNVRFMSGVRKQPMFKGPSSNTSIKRKLSKQSPPRLKQTPLRSRPTQDGSKARLSDDGSFRSADSTSKRRRRKKSVISSKLDNICSQLVGLQRKLTSMERKQTNLGIVRAWTDDPPGAKVVRKLDAKLIKEEAVKRMEFAIKVPLLGLYWYRLRAVPRKAIDFAAKLRAPIANKLGLKNSMPSISESVEAFDGKQDGLGLIQSCIRRRLAELMYERRNHAAVTIQKRVKSRQTSLLYWKIRAAAIFIQSCFRGFASRKRLKSKLRSKF